MKKILVLGSANADLLIHTERMPKLGETVNGYDFVTNAGGKGLNQAVAIKKLGGNVSFFGAIGNDSNGDMLCQTLNKYAISFVGIKSHSTPTGTAIVTVINGDNFIILNKGANALITKEVIKENFSLIAESDYLVLQLEIPIDAIIEAINIAKENNTKIILNPAPFSALPDSVYKNIDYLIPNEHEAECIVGFPVDDEESCIKAIKSIQDKGVKNVVITLGSKGCVYSDNNAIKFFNAIDSKVVDTTSAGDSFIGALITKLAEGLDITDAIPFATKVASITVSRSGASISIPFANEVI